MKASVALKNEPIHPSSSGMPSQLCGCLLAPRTQGVVYCRTEMRDMYISMGEQYNYSIQYIMIHEISVSIFACC
jgi:hypothetical protein